MDAEDVDVGVFGDAFLDVGVEFDGQFFALFGCFGHVHHFGALGFGHCGGFLSLCGVQRKLSKFHSTLVILLPNFLIFVVGAKISREFLGEDDVNACLHQLFTELSCTTLITGLTGSR